MSIERVPKNLSATWHLGSRSFTEINSHHPTLHLEYSKFAPYGEQLPESDFKFSWEKALALALLHPDWSVQWVRYDLEGSFPEDENNRPYREGKMVKTMKIFGHTIVQGMGGDRKY